MFQNWYYEEGSKFSPAVGDLATNHLNTSVTITSNSGSPFDFSQIGLADNLGNYNHNSYFTGTVNFTFNYANGSQSTSAVTLSEPYYYYTGLQIATFNQNDLTSVVMTQTSMGGSGNYLQFNDVGLSAYTAPGNGGVTPTPELPTYLMGLLGLGGIALLRRRQLQA